jgi:DNA replication protein DnaC
MTNMKTDNFLEQLEIKAQNFNEEKYLQRKAELEKEEVAEQKKAELRLWRERGITERYINASWDNWSADTIPKQAAKDFAKTAFETNLLFYGNNGTGKTHLAVCLAKDGATYRRLPDIFREVRMDFKCEENMLDFYGNRKLLVIDEVGRQKCSEFEINLFFEIIDRRWNNVLPTTLITNLSPNELADIYGSAILDRLRPQIVNFNWRSMRATMENLNNVELLPKRETQ